MSGLTLSEVRTALADQIRAGLARDTNVYSHPHGSYAIPAITIDAASDYLDYFVTMTGAGFAAARFVVRVEPKGSSVTDRPPDVKSAAIALDDYLSAGAGNGSSIIDAIYADKTLGLTGCTCQVSSVTVNTESMTAELAVEVTIKKVGANA